MRRHPTTLAVKVCVASGLAGLGAAGIVAAGLGLRPSSAGAPQTSSEPATTFGVDSAAGSPDPALAFDPSSTAAADPPVSLDPGSWGDPGTTLGIDDPGPGGPLDPSGTGDPPAPRNPADPRDPPARVPEPSGAAIIAVGLSAAALWRNGLSRSMARNETAGRRRGASDR